MPSQSIRVQKFRQMHGGKPVDLYLTAMPASELLKKVKMATYGAVEGGYQRAPSESRMRTIARYVQKAEGMLPGAVVANVRRGAQFIPDGPGSSFGTFQVPEEEPFWVIDGQHRTGGLAIADEQVRRNPAASLSYDVPVVFCSGFETNEEMHLFLIVNSTAKSVPTDLTAELIHEKVLAGGEATVKLQDLRKAVGVDIAHYLNEQPGPWRNHIRTANEPKSDVAQKPMQVNTVAASLRPVLGERWVEGFYRDRETSDRERLAQIVLTYWSALAELMPAAFEDIAHHAVQRPIGVYSFHELLPYVLDDCRRQGSFSRATFRSLLERLEEWVSPQTWHTGEGEDLVKANNRQSIQAVVSRMLALYHIETPGLQD